MHKGRAGMWRSGQGDSCWPVKLVRPFLATAFAPFPCVTQNGATLSYPFLGLVSHLSRERESGLHSVVPGILGYVE